MTLADVIWPELAGRAVEVARKPVNRPDISARGADSVISRPEFLEHQLSNIKTLKQSWSAGPDTLSEEGAASAIHFLAGRKSTASSKPLPRLSSALCRWPSMPPESGAPNWPA